MHHTCLPGQRLKHFEIWLLVQYSESYGFDTAIFSQEKHTMFSSVLKCWNAGVMMDGISLGSNMRIRSQWHCHLYWRSLNELSLKAFKNDIQLWHIFDGSYSRIKENPWVSFRGQDIPSQFLFASSVLSSRHFWLFLDTSTYPLQKKKHMKSRGTVESWRNECC